MSSKKGIQLTMQTLVIIIILLVLLAFLLIFFMGQGSTLTQLWGSFVEGSIENTQAAVGP